MYSFSIVVIENLYIQTSLMVALSLFRVKEGGGPIYKSEVDIINYIYIYIFLCLLQCNITVYTYLFIYAVNE